MHSTGVLEEAEFYNVADLVALVKQHIADRDAARNQVCWTTERCLNEALTNVSLHYWDIAWWASIGTPGTWPAAVPYDSPVST